MISGNDATIPTNLPTIPTNLPTIPGNGAIIPGNGSTFPWNGETGLKRNATISGDGGAISKRRAMLSGQNGRVGQVLGMRGCPCRAPHLSPKKDVKGPILRRARESEKLACYPRLAPTPP